MKIIDHGKWVPYKPPKDNWPDGAPPNALFCKRESDGMDWYAYVNPVKVYPDLSIDTIRGETKPKANPVKQRLFSENFQDDSVKIAFMFHDFEQAWKIGPATTDPTMIFPANMYVREILDFGSIDEDEIIKAFRNKLIDPETNVMSDPPPLPPPVNLFELIADLQRRVELLEQKNG